MNNYSFIFAGVRKRDDSKVAAIQDATLDLVLEQGLSGVTMCEISKAAGIATGTCYIYVKGKEELMHELFWLCRRESAAYYFHDFDPKASFEEGFQRIFRNMVQYRVDEFRKFVYLEQCYHSPFISQEVRKESLKALDPLFSLLERGKKEGVVKPVHREVLMGYLLGPINEVIKKAHYSHREITKSMIDSMYQMCLDGVRLQPACSTTER